MVSQIIKELLLNSIVISVVAAVVISNIWKFIDRSFRNKKLDLYGIIATGGMPSSHACFVCSLAVSIGIVEGFTSSVFLLAAGVSMIVIRDAFGVRRDVDRVTSMINDIIRQKKLGIQEILKITGHTPVQVIVGCILGILIPIAVQAIRLKGQW